MRALLELDLAAVSPEQLRAAMALAIAVGTLYCFLGYRVFKVVLALTGFFLAGSVAGALAGWVTQGKLIPMGIALVCGGAAGAFALFFLYKVGVFCLGAIGAALVAHNLLAFRSETWVASAVLAAAVFGGLAALMVERPIMTIVTAAIGAWIVVHSLAFFILGAGYLDTLNTALNETETRYAVLVCWTVLAAAGAIAQFATHKGSGPIP